jgi:hypothetical protein
MGKIEKIFIGDNCPNCSNDLIVFTTCGEENDTEFKRYYYDGDDVICAVDCGFISSIYINEDNGCAYIDDGNIDMLKECE